MSQPEKSKRIFIHREKNSTKNGITSIVKLALDEKLILKALGRTRQVKVVLKGAT